MRIELQNKPHGRSIKGIKCKGLYDDAKGRRSFQSVTRQIVKDWIDSEVKIKIYSTMLLHSKERWFIIASSRL